MEIIRMGHTYFLVKVKLTWVQDSGCPLGPNSSQRLPTNILNISYGKNSIN